MTFFCFRPERLRNMLTKGRAVIREAIRGRFAGAMSWQPEPYGPFPTEGEHLLARASLVVVSLKKGWRERRRKRRRVTLSERENKLRAFSHARPT